LREYKAEIAQIKTHSNEVDVTIMRASGDVNTQLARIAGDLTATRLDVSYMRDLLNEFRVSPFAGAAQNRAKLYEAVAHDYANAPRPQSGTVGQTPTPPPSRGAAQLQDWMSKP